MNQKEKTQKNNWISTKTKYKLNVYKKGTIYANSILDLIYKIITKKYIKNENPNLGKGRKSRNTQKRDLPVQQLNS